MADYKLTCDNITFNNAAIDSGALVDVIEYTDSTGEVYALDEGIGTTITGSLGSVGTIINPVWVLVVTAPTICMAMAMGMAIPFGAGK